MRNVIGFMACTFAVFVFSACSVKDPTIVGGREWNPGAQVVADTTSQFNIDDPMVIQFNYGKNFDFKNLKTTFYEGTIANKGKEIWSHEVRVNDKLGTYTLQGKSQRKGGLLNAQELTRHKGAGSVVVEFSADGKVIVAKEFVLVIPSEK